MTTPSNIQADQENDTIQDIDRLLMPPPPPQKRRKEEELLELENSTRSGITINEESSAISRRSLDVDNHLSTVNDNERTHMDIFEKQQEQQQLQLQQQQQQQDKVLVPKIEEKVIVSKVRFNHIIGHADAKLRLDEVLLPLALPSSIADSVLTGVRSAPASILLHGPPGTARAVAGEAQAAFISVGPSDILSKFVGESEASVRNLFKEARRKASLTESNCSVLFFDEIDALGQSRGNAGSNCGGAGNEQENSSAGSRRLLAEILIQMTALTSNDDETNNEGNTPSFGESLNINENEKLPRPSPISPVSPLENADDSDETNLTHNPHMADAEGNFISVHERKSKARVIVIAATNRPEDCDPALLRRFAVRVLIGLPTQRDRKRMVRRLLLNIDHNITSKELDDIAIATEGWSGSDLESLSREAVMAPVRDCLQYAARMKTRLRKRRQKEDVESYLKKEEVSPSYDDADDQARDALLRSFQNLRPVNIEDFDKACNFWTGVDHSQRYIGVKDHYQHYDSSSSDEES